MLAIVQAAFRGSLRATSTGTRAQGKPKPLFQKAPISCCVKVHCVVLDRLSDHIFQTTNLNPLLQLDPFSDSLLFQIKPEKVAVKEEWHRVLATVVPDVLDALMNAKKGKPLMKDTAPGLIGIFVSRFSTIRRRYQKLFFR